MKFTRPWSGSALYVLVHTRFFDDFLRHASWVAGAKQVVLLAAGIDARTFRLDWPPGTRLYELDRPEVLSVKNEIIADAGAQPPASAHDWSGPGAPCMVRGALLNAVYEAHKPSVWLMECLLLYITEPAARTLLGTASALTVPRSGLGMDLVNEDPLTSPTMQPLFAAFLAWRPSIP